MMNFYIHETRTYISNKFSSKESLLRGWGYIYSSEQALLESANFLQATIQHAFRGYVILEQYIFL